MPELGPVVKKGPVVAQVLVLMAMELELVQGLVAELAHWESSWTSWVSWLSGHSGYVL